MSIINDALKKARRNADMASFDGDETGDVTIHPKVLSHQPSLYFLFVPVLILLVIFMLASIALGYFLYKEYIHTPAEEITSTEKRSEEQIIEMITPLPPITAETGGEEIVTSADPVNADRLKLTPRKILDQLQIHGIMRGAANPGILTQTGVYREGDLLRAPEGYRLIRIEENHITVKSPDGHEQIIELP